MSLLHYYLTHESKKLKRENVRLKVIGSRARLDKKIVDVIDEAEALTAKGQRTLVIAVDYGGQWDIAQATQKLVADVVSGALLPADINAECVNQYTTLSEFPPLDLLIRTGGEHRISNFLLWQSAYAEFYFSDKLWPEFDEQALSDAIHDFYSRQRRFGLTSDQIEAGEGA